MSETNDYATGNLFDYEYFSNNYKLIAADLSKQTELENPYLKRQINLIGKIDNSRLTAVNLCKQNV